MKILKLKKVHVAAFAEIERTQLDKIIVGEWNYTIETLLKVLKTVDLELSLSPKGMVIKPIEKMQEPAKTEQKPAWP